MDAGRQWALETFGQHGVHIRNEVARYVREEHEASADAQDASGHRSRGVYGEFWRGILERFEQLADLPGAALVRPGRAPYRVPQVNGVTVFPWRYARSKDEALATATFTRSDARISLFNLAAAAVQPELDLDLPRPELSAAERQLADQVEAALQDSMNTGGRLVVVAVASSSLGLFDLQWGEARHGADGCLEWGFRESLMGLQPADRPVSTSPTRTFTSGDVPARLVQAREDLTSDE